MSKYKVDNKELKNELIKYIDSCKFKWKQKADGNWRRVIKERGTISPRLGEMIQKIARGLSTRGNWCNYTWREDFVSQAILTALKYMHNFNAEKYSNAHGYINMICSHAFMQYVKKEKNHSSIKQKLYDKKNEEFGDNTVNYESLVDVEEKKEKKEKE